MKRFRYLLMILLSIMVLASTQVDAQTNNGFLPPSEVINADNVNQLQEVATLGLGEIYNTAYSPNGEGVAIASATGLSVYSVNDWSKPSHVIKTDGERVAVAFTEDVKSLVTYPINFFYWSTAETGDLKSYDIASGSMKILATDFTKSVDNIVVDPQGRWIATVQQECKHFYDGIKCGNNSYSVQQVRIRIWSMTSGELLETITPNAHIYDLEFMPHASSLVFLGHGVEDTDSLVWWDVKDNKQTASWRFESNLYTQFAISGDGHTVGLLLAKAGKHYIHVDFLDIQTSAIHRSFEASYEALEATGFYYSHDMDYDFLGRIWLNADATQVFTQEYTDPGIGFHIWDTRTGVDIFPQTDSYVHDLSFSQISDISLILQFDGTILQWSSSSQKAHTLLAGLPVIQKVILSADDKLVAVEGDRYGHSLYDFQMGGRLTLPPNSRPLAISTDNSLVALATDHKIRIWNRKNNRFLISIPLNEDSALTAAFSRNNKLLAVGLEVPMTFDKDGNIEDSSWQAVRIYNVQTGKLLAVERSYAGRDKRLFFSTDGRLLVTDGGIWNVKEWLLSGLVDQANSTVWFVGLPMALSKDGRLLATVWTDENNGNVLRIIHVFDVQSHKELFTFDAHHGDVKALAFNPSATLLASASGDGDASVRDNSVRLWDMETGKELMTLETQHNDFMRDVVFSNDGKYIITAYGGCDCEGGDANSAIRVWGIPSNAKYNP